jgi:superfamily II DNA or RNA helicase
LKPIEQKNVKYKNYIYNLIKNFDEIEYNDFLILDHEGLLKFFLNKVDMLESKIYDVKEYLSTHPDDLFEKQKLKNLEFKLKQYNSIFGEKCPICLEDIKIPMMFECNHFICMSCFENFKKINGNNPVFCIMRCKKTIDHDYIQKMSHFAMSKKEDLIYNEWLNVLNPLGAEGKCIITYCSNSFLSNFTVDKFFFSKLAFKYINITQRTKNVAELILQFKESKDVRFLFLNIKYFSTGLNLQFVNYLVILNELESDQFIQILGRINRYNPNGNSARVIQFILDKEENEDEVSKKFHIAKKIKK